MAGDASQKLQTFLLHQYEYFYRQGYTYDESISIISLIIQYLYDFNSIKSLNFENSTLLKAARDYSEGKNWRLQYRFNNKKDAWETEFKELITVWQMQVPKDKLITDEFTATIMRSFASELMAEGPFIDITVGTGRLLQGLKNIYGQDIDFKLRAIAETYLCLHNGEHIKLKTNDSIEDVYNDTYSHKGVYIFDPPIGKRQKKPNNWSSLNASKILGNSDRTTNNTEIIILVNFLLKAPIEAHFICKFSSSFLTTRDKESDELRKYLIENNLLCVIKNPDGFITLVGSNDTKKKEHIVALNLNKKTIQDNRMEEIANLIINESNIDDLVGFLEKIINRQSFIIYERKSLINELKGNIINFPATAFEEKTYENPIVYFNQLIKNEKKIIIKLQEIKDHFIELGLNKVMSIEDISIVGDIPKEIEPQLIAKEKEEDKKIETSPDSSVEDIYWFLNKKNSENPVSEALSEIYPNLTELNDNMQQGVLFLKQTYIDRDKYKTFFNYLKITFDDRRVDLFSNIDIDEGMRNIIQVNIKQNIGVLSSKKVYHEFIMPVNFQKQGEISIPLSLLSKKQQEIYINLCAYWFDYKAFNLNNFDKYTNSELFLAFNTMYELGLIVHLNGNNNYIELYDEYRPFHPLIEEDFR